MSYAVKEIFYTLQGEGKHAGRPAVFCRFSGCNLWNGKEADREHAICKFCDTDFVGTNGPGGGRFQTAHQLAKKIAETWPERYTGKAKPFVVCTGGEPLLQMDKEFVDALHACSFEIAIETNGTKPIPAGIDWVCVSPKANSKTVVTKGDELKLVFPQPGAMPERFAHFSFHHFYLQPMDGLHQATHTQQAIEYCLAHPQWNLSIQTHKFLGIP